MVGLVLELNKVNMFNRDRWKEIMEVLSGNVFRTLATSFGVVGVYLS
ncbi:hypothetical protein [Maribacter confluentis]